MALRLFKDDDYISWLKEINLKKCNKLLHKLLYRQTKLQLKISNNLLDKFHGDIIS